MKKNMKKALCLIAVASLLNVPMQSSAAGYYILKSMRVKSSLVMPDYLTPIYASDVLVCKTASCSLTRSVSAKTCNAFKWLSADTDVMGFQAGGGITLPGVAATGAAGGMTWTNKSSTSSDSETCSTSTVTHTCNFSNGYSANIKGYVQYRKTISYIQKTYSTAGGNIYTDVTATGIVPRGEVVGCNVYKTL